MEKVVVSKEFSRAIMPGVNRVCVRGVFKHYTVRIKSPIIMFSDLGTAKTEREALAIKMVGELWLKGSGFYSTCILYDRAAKILAKSCLDKEDFKEAVIKGRIKSKAFIKEVFSLDKIREVLPLLIKKNRPLFKDYETTFDPEITERVYVKRTAVMTMAPREGRLTGNRKRVKKKIDYVESSETMFDFQMPKSVFSVSFESYEEAVCFGLWFTAFESYYYKAKGRKELISKLLPEWMERMVKANPEIEKRMVSGFTKRIQQTITKLLFSKEDETIIKNMFENKEAIVGMFCQGCSI